MWRAAVATAVLLLAVLAIRFWPGEQIQVSGENQALRQTQVQGGVLPDCAKAVLQDWISDDRIDGTYPKSCYEAFLEVVPEGGYGVGGLLVALHEKLR